MDLLQEYHTLTPIILELQCYKKVSFAHYSQSYILCDFSSNYLVKMVIINIVNVIYIEFVLTATFNVAMISTLNTVNHYEIELHDAEELERI